MAQSPLVTVVVPSYNHRSYLPERLESILSQSFVDFELILLDDASTDGSIDYLSQFQDRQNVRLIQNETNSGSPFAQWNRGLKEAKGKYVWIAESDDTAKSDFLEEMVQVLEENANVGIVSCGVTLINEESQSVGEIKHDAFLPDQHRWQNDFVVNGIEEINNFLFVQNTIPSASAVLFRRSLYLQAGDADSSLKLCGDWLQWMHIVMLCDLAFITKRLASSRIHPVTQRQGLAQQGQLELESLIVQHNINQTMSVKSTAIRQATERSATSWLQGVRAGRYNGKVAHHVVFFFRLLRLNKIVAFKFLLKFPLCFIIWIAKRTLFRNRL